MGLHGATLPKASISAEQAPGVNRGAVSFFSGTRGCFRLIEHLGDREMLACSTEVGVARFDWYLFRNGNNNSYPYRCEDGTESLCAVPQRERRSSHAGQYRKQSESTSFALPCGLGSACPMPHGKVSGVGAFGDAWF